MVRSLLPWLVLVTLLSGIGSSHAQATARTVRPDPLNAQAVVAARVHTSSFAAYRRHSDAAPIGWKEANDTVARVGGWRAYAREAADSAPASASAPGTAASGSKP